MILAAGLGTRLRPLTNDRPKAMVNYQGKPLIAHAIEKLRAHGFSSVIINVHHFAEQIVNFVRSMDDFGIEIEFSHEEELLDTGGGIARAQWFLKDGPFLVYNVDIMSDIDLRMLFDHHIESGALATMAVKQRVTSRSLLMNRQGYLKGWRDNRSGETILAGVPEDELLPIAFSAIHVMNPEVFNLFPEEEAFSLMPFYLKVAASHPVKLFRHDRDYWEDMGKLESFS